MMKNIFKLSSILVLVLFFTGCMSSTTTIIVNKDGSGKIVEKMGMSKEMLNMMKSMGNMVPQGEESEESLFDIFDEEELKGRVSEMGEGVTYQSGEKWENDTQEGYLVTYTFEDINKVKVNQNPGGKAPGDGSPMGDDSEEEYLTFDFQLGSTSVLKIISPKLKNDFDKPEEQPAIVEDDPMAEMMMAQMAQILKGMKVAINIEVEGNIVETNATHKEGSKVTIMEIDFDKLLADPEKFKQFAKAQPESLEEAKTFVKDLPGIKVELSPEIEIKFK